MNHAAFFRFSILAACATLTYGAQAADFGSCSYHDKKMQLTDGIAFNKPNEMHPEKQDLYIALTSEKLDMAQIDASKNLWHTIIFDEPSAGRLLLGIPTDAVTYFNAKIPEGGTYVFDYDDPMGVLKLTKKDAHGVAGAYVSTAEGKQGVVCNLTFDVPMAK